MKNEIDQWFAEWMRKIPDEYKQTAVQILDELVIYLSTLYRQKGNHADIERRILVEGRMRNPDLETIEDMQKLQIQELEYIEEKFKSKYRLYSLVEGGVSGTGHPLLIALDFPALLAINMRMVQYIAGTYGYSLTSSFEQMLALKVIHAASLPEEYRNAASEWVVNQLESDSAGIFPYTERVVEPEWLESMAKQWVKSLTLYGMRKTSRNHFSILGIAIGANFSYQFTKQIDQFASRLYRYRYLQTNQKQT